MLFVENSPLRQTLTSAEGAFTFDSVPRGLHYLRAAYIGLVAVDSVWVSVPPTARAVVVDTIRLADQPPRPIEF
jgi:hypothetical protein